MSYLGEIAVWLDVGVASSQDTTMEITIVVSFLNINTSVCLAIMAGSNV